MHSGYHLIDIVMWWLKYANPGIRSAQVFSSFERFSYPSYMVNGENHNIEKTAAIQIQFFHDDQLRKPTCLASLLMTLGGPDRSSRETYFLVH